MNEACKILLLLSSLMVSACRHHASAPRDAKPAADSDDKFVDEKHGFSVKYTDPWKKRNNESKQDVLTLRRDEAKGEITIAVPHLPPHIPGLIPLQAVEKGYVDDVKKRMKNVSETESKPVKIAGASGRRFTVNGELDGQQRTIGVYVLLKGDTLYVMSSESPADVFEDVKTAFEQIARSWKWI